MTLKNIFQKYCKVFQVCFKCLTVFKKHCCKEHSRTCSGQRHPLFLTARQGDSFFTDLRHVAVHQDADVRD